MANFLFDVNPPFFFCVCVCLQMMEELFVLRPENGNYLIFIYFLIGNYLIFMFERNV